VSGKGIRIPAEAARLLGVTPGDELDVVPFGQDLT
jgi:antitoxin component of MazEF toxin-antitoxin module